MIDDQNHGWRSKQQTRRKCANDRGVESNLTVGCFLFLSGSSPNPSPVPFFSAPFRVDSSYLCLGLLGFFGNVAILIGFGLRHLTRQEML